MQWMLDTLMGLRDVDLSPSPTSDATLLLYPHILFHLPCLPLPLSL